MHLWAVRTAENTSLEAVVFWNIWCQHLAGAAVQSLGVKLGLQVDITTMVINSHKLRYNPFCPMVPYGYITRTI